MTTPKTFLKKTGMLMLATSFVGAMAIQPATAAVISTDMLISGAAQQQSAGSPVDQLLAREDVRAQLTSLGVDPAQVQDRIAALSPAELARLNQQIGEQPAGAGFFAVVGLVFVVLLILELLGITHIFSAI